MDLLRRLLYFAVLLPSTTGIFGADVAREANGIGHGFGFELRVRPGECYRLYSIARMAAFADFQLPEMQRSPLEELCLQVRMLAEASSLGAEASGIAATVGTGEGSTAAFLAQAPEPPVPQAITHAVTLLQNI